MSLDEFIEEFDEQKEKKKITVFTGAGLSTASGIKDFRGENGLYKENVNAEDILSIQFFLEHPEEFYDFYWKKLAMNESIKPNIAHEFIKEYQELGYIDSVITQNIDGLDTKAGTRNVVELHGNANKFYCTHCNKKYSIEQLNPKDIVPTCSECGAIIRPDIVLYEENLEQYKLWQARQQIAMSNTLLVIGSTLRVNPAASMVHDFLVQSRYDKSKKTFIINKGETSFDGFSEISKYDGDVIEAAKVLRKKYNR